VSAPLPKAFAVPLADLGLWTPRAAYLLGRNRCDWPTRPLREIVRVRFEVVPEDEIEASTTHLLDRISFDEGRIHAGKRQVTRMTQYRACPGDLVVSKINARKRAIGLMPDGPDIGVSIHFRALVPTSQDVDPVFLWRALRSSYCRAQFDAATGGIGKGEISEENLLNVRVPVPPLDVQRAIVAHAAHAEAEAAALLADADAVEAAFESTVEATLGLPPSPPRRQLQAFALTWADIERWGVAFLKASANALDLSAGHFPAERLDSLLLGLQYGTSVKANTTGQGEVVIRMNNLQNGLLDLRNIKHVSFSEEEAERLYLCPGDILINRTNSKELVGKCAVFNETGRYVFASYLIRARVDTALALPEYIALVINGRIGRQQIDRMSRPIGGQANINSEEIRSIKIPLPPLDVQAQIVADVQAVRARAAALRAEARTRRRTAAAEVEAMLLGTAPPPTA